MQHMCLLTTLSGNPFANITGLPIGYTIDYNYQSTNALALIQASGITLGDWDRNSLVNNADVSVMLKALTDLAAYKTQYLVANDDELKAIGDFNNSGSITNGDIQGLLNFLASQPNGGSIATVPEPAAMVSALIAALSCSIFIRKRRTRIL
jgi:hypothetical protein